MASPAVTCAPASPTSVLTACVIACSDVPANDHSAQDISKYPVDPQITYYFEATASGQDALKSHEFAPNGGAHQWFDVIFPAAGSWTVALRKVSDDSSVATASVTVS